MRFRIVKRGEIFIVQKYQEVSGNPELIDFPRIVGYFWDTVVAYFDEKEARKWIEGVMNPDPEEVVFDTKMS